MDRRAQSASTRSVLWRSYRITFLFVSIMVELIWQALTLKNQPPDVAEPRRTALYQRQATRFRRRAEEMGGLLIKVGQFLSSRVDLLPKPYLDELAKLQDSVQAAPWAAVRPILEKELGSLSDHFVWFGETPVAAASLGQVYEAVLKDGPRVAVKVQRPGIHRIVEADLKALGWVVSLATRFSHFGRTFDLRTVLREFRRLVFEELDYHRELTNTEAIREDLAADPTVVVPETFPALSTGRVLVMEFCEGIKIDRVAELEAHNISRAQVAERVIRLYLHMVLESGLYHADPHAGNLLVDDDGRIVLLDYGMVGSLDLATKRHIRHIFVAVSTRDPGALIEAMSAIGMIRPDADIAALRRRLSYLFDRYYAETLDQLGNLDIPQMLRDAESILRDQAIQVPGYFAFLGRAIAILVGLSTAIYPEINLIELFTPYVRRFVTEEAGGTAGYMAQHAKRYARTLAELPLLSAKVLHTLDQGNLETQIEWVRGQTELARVNRSVRLLSSNLSAVGLVIAGVMALGNHTLWLGRVLLAIGALVFLAGRIGRKR
ncbi:ABC1 kinase family protein [Sulfobacillus harzensis]|uniref:AarF/ABC1/UbiB kinase family protein n=1 Tax=Sulfobacillus harzensis TaxID=2729629 RepID=A0A7Y0L3N0_9FIRM|nr:AarF/UbiB family protein [Sulfobacillus harzensis]NMP22688.1 AarF/ABC1/UbiB kinase family protein [Sulfobacillus harzensis]